MMCCHLAGHLGWQQMFEVDEKANTMSCNVLLSNNSSLIQQNQCPSFTENVSGGHDAPHVPVHKDCTKDNLIIGAF